MLCGAIDAVNTLVAAQNLGRMMDELCKHVRPTLPVLDELSYLPIDKPSADLLFQTISRPYERGATVITSNCVI